jgi:hypothetical protein
MSYRKENPIVEASNTTTAVPSPISMNASNAQPAAAAAGDGVDHNGNSAGKVQSILPGKVPNVTLRTIFMAILVAMGGFIFGYDTGKAAANRVSTSSNSAIRSDLRLP